MDELTIGDKTYISSKKAAQITGYAKDYVGQLCRGGYVEATMVGRNWYVLEKSIRDHRFGNEVKKEAEPRDDGKTVGADPYRETWDAPIYEPEPLVGMVTVAPRPVMPPQEPAVPTEAENQTASDTLTDMQSAWQEWFAQKQQAKIEAPQVLEARAAIAEAEEEGLNMADTEPEEELLLPEAEELAPELAQEPAAEAESVPVAIHRTVTLNDISRSPAPTQSPVYEPVAINNTYGADISEEGAVKREEEEEPAVIIREYVSRKPVRAPRVRKQRDGSVASSTAVLQALFIAIIVIAVGIAVLGTGFGDRYNSRTGLQYSAIHFFNGATIYKAK